jgi:hypothetical protein
VNYLSINGKVIRGNAMRGTDDPPIRIARSHSDKAPRYAREVVISGPSRLVYNPAKAIMRCGARLVLEVDGDVEIVR